MSKETDQTFAEKRAIPKTAAYIESHIPMHMPTHAKERMLIYTEEVKRA